MYMYKINKVLGRTRSDYARHARGLLVNSLRNESVTTLSCHPLSTVSSLSVPDSPCSLYARAPTRPSLSFAIHRSSIFSSESSYISHEFPMSFRLSRMLVARAPRILLRLQFQHMPLRARFRIPVEESVARGTEQTSSPNLFP
ncbi:hypothetical protein PUN28_018139 [Cardiocondyla obscurior]|uniref:Uncharacterized protein n=1 Tax=Cardiocondyla obscurior TaxID=286306 RepID=A0AAW2ELW3_9HYME